MEIPFKQSQKTYLNYLVPATLVLALFLHSNNCAQAKAIPMNYPMDTDPVLCDLGKYPQTEIPTNWHEGKCRLEMVFPESSPKHIFIIFYQNMCEKIPDFGINLIAEYMCINVSHLDNGIQAVMTVSPSSCSKMCWVFFPSKLFIIPNASSCGDTELDAILNSDTADAEYGPKNVLSSLQLVTENLRCSGVGMYEFRAGRILAVIVLFRLFYV